MPHRTLVTGFLAFGGFAVNPSALLAQGCGRRFELVEVSFAAADAFLGRLDPSSFDRLVLMGVAGKSTVMRLERTAHNVIGPGADVRGITRPGLIEPDGSPALAATLWPASLLDAPSADWAGSDDAGDYLCNYLLYRALRRFPQKRVGFLHVPPADAVPLDRQQVTLARLLAGIERRERAVQR